MRTDGADLLEIAEDALTVDGGRWVGEHGGVSLGCGEPLGKWKTQRDCRGHDHNGRRGRI